MRSLFTSILCFGLALLGTAQTDCSNALYEAHKMYIDGKIAPCIERLESCLSGLKTKEEKFESYKLLAKAYNDKNDPASRDMYIKKLLKIEPDYSTQHNSESKTFNRAVRRYKVEPMINGGMFAGLNTNNPMLIQSYSALDVGQRYNTKYGYQAGLMANYALPTNTRIGLQASVIGVNYEHEMENPGVWRKTYTENIMSFGLDVSAVQVVSLTKGISGYAGGLFGTTFTNQSRAVLQDDDLINGISRQLSQNNLEMRNRQVPIWGICAGIEYAQPTGTLNLEVRYVNYTKTLFNEDARYDDMDFIYSTEYVYDDISARLWTISLGYSVPILYRIAK